MRRVRMKVVEISRINNDDIDSRVNGYTVEIMEPFNGNRFTEVIVPYPARIGDIFEATQSDLINHQNVFSKWNQCQR